MKPSSLLILVVAAGIASGCGARTSDDDLLDYSTSAEDRRSAGGFSNYAPGCCSAQPNPGCGDSEVERCVCEVAPQCCTDGWSEDCVAIGGLCGTSCSQQGSGGDVGTGGGFTGGGPGFTGGTGGTGGGFDGTGGDLAGSGGGDFMSTGGAPPIPGGNCCEAHGGRGCQVPQVADCVCDSDEYCCNTQWDATCASLAPICGGQCMSSGTGGGFGSGGSLPGTGGGFGSGGGAQACTDLFPGDCGECACSNCFSQLSACLAGEGCVPLFTCQITSGCNCTL